MCIMKNMVKQKKAPERSDCAGYGSMEICTQKNEIN